VEVGPEVRVADGVSVSAGDISVVWIEVASRVTVGMDAGTKSLSAMGCPVTPMTTAKNARAMEVTSHCHPVTVRARRVR
jgi:hypothetical protein